MTKTGSASTASRHSSYATTADDILSQRLSAEELPGGLATILVSTTNNADNKHRTTAVNHSIELFTVGERNLRTEMPISLSRKITIRFLSPLSIYVIFVRINIEEEEKKN